MQNSTLNVEGMSCSHCVNAIKKALSALDGVNEVEVTLEKNTVTVQYNASKVTIDAIKNEIVEQGYEVV